jgi:hypothetical protein
MASAAAADARTGASVSARAAWSAGIASDAPSSPRVSAAWARDLASGALCSTRTTGDAARRLRCAWAACGSSIATTGSARDQVERRMDE